MSVSQTVYVRRDQLPNREGWMRGIAKHDFPLELDAEFDPTRATGTVPCQYAGAAAGFEYEIAPAAVDDDALRKRIGARDTAVSFITHARMADLTAATIAAAVLATIADGVMWVDAASEVCESPLDMARDFAGRRDEEPAAPPAEPTSQAVDLPTKVVFRGTALATLATLEDPPRRFTVKVPVGDGDVRILAVWQHPVGSATVHRLRAGDATFELDPRGVPLS